MTHAAMHIRRDDLSGPEIRALLEEHLRMGAGRVMLDHIVKEARSRGYSRLSLETGSHAAFEPARRLYESFGFNPCAPFNGYAEDPHSVFMSREI